MGRADELSAFAIGFCNSGEEVCLATTSVLERGYHGSQ